MTRPQSNADFIMRRHEMQERQRMQQYETMARMGNRTAFDNVD